MASVAQSMPYAADTSITVAGAVPGPGTSWGAIIAGAFSAVVLSLVLLILGSGIGLSSVSLWVSTEISITDLGIGAAIWLVVTQVVSSGLGGYLAGRLRTKWTGIHSNEVFFRDTAHGFLAWAVATVFTVGFMTATISSILGAGTQATATALSGIGQSVAQVASAATDDVEATTPILDRLYRSDRASAERNLSDIRAETKGILRDITAEGGLAPADKTYLAGMVAARTGITTAEAESRVDAMVAEVRAAELRAKSAADSAREAAALLSLITVIALLAGALVASVSAAWGGRQRDRGELGDVLLSETSRRA